MSAELAMVVPSRGRPLSVQRQGHAWKQTMPNGGADLIWVLDADDPGYDEYCDRALGFPFMKVLTIESWAPMVPKLNSAARVLAPDYRFLGFIGDDHLPRTRVWHEALALWLAAAGTGIAYGMDGFQNENLPTWWCMTSNIVEALGGRMVPAPVQHMYCDNAVQVLGQRAGVIDFLPHVTIEHIHPVAGKAEWDEGYKRVNRAEQYERDRTAFTGWLADGLQADVDSVRRLRGV